MDATNQLSWLLDKAKEIANGSASEDEKAEDGDEDSNDSDDSFNQLFQANKMSRQSSSSWESRPTPERSLNLFSKKGFPPHVVN